MTHRAWAPGSTIADQAISRYPSKSVGNRRVFATPSEGAAAILRHTLEPHPAEGPIRSGLEQVKGSMLDRVCRRELRTFRRSTTRGAGSGAPASACGGLRTALARRPGGVLAWPRGAGGVTKREGREPEGVLRLLGFVA
jgi:hypothetical protein